METCEAIFSNKTPFNNNITLSEKYHIVTDSTAIHNDIYRNIVKGCFPVNLKNADITPTFKKDDRLLKINYRPVGILPTLSKSYIPKFTNILMGFFLNI